MGLSSWLGLISTRIKGSIQRFLGSDKAVANHNYVVPNFVWILTRLIVNFCHYLIMTLNTKWSHKTKRFEITKCGLMYIFYLAATGFGILACVIYIAVCIKYEIGKVDLYFVVAQLLFLITVLILDIYRLANPELTAETYNVTYQLCILSGTVPESDADRNYIISRLKSAIFTFMFWVPGAFMLFVLVLASERLYCANLAIAVLEVLGFSRALYYVFIIFVGSTWGLILMSGGINTTVEFLISQIVVKHFLDNSARKMYEVILIKAGLNVPHSNYQQATITYNIIQNSYQLRLPIFLILSIILSFLLFTLIELIEYELMYILVSILVSLLALWITCAIKWTHKLGSSLTNASVEHKRAYEEFRHKLNVEDRLRLKSWRQMQFQIGNTLEVENQQFLTVNG